MGTRTEKIGILSDTHGQAEMAERAAAVLARHSPELVFHCGDIGGEAVINALLSLPMVYVFGNVDDDRAGLRRYIAALGAACEEPFAERELAGRRIAAIHGHNEHQLRDLVESQRYDYLLHGHTHVLRDDRVGRTRILNPGALYRTPEPTILILDPSANRVRKFLIARPGKPSDPG